MRLRKVCLPNRYMSALLWNRCALRVRRRFRARPIVAGMIIITTPTGLLQRGMSEAMAQANLDMWIAYNRGLDTAEPRTPQATTPTSFRQWCEAVLKPRVMA